jgi:quercetin dioxygenase-like cupin family protein
VLALTEGSGMDDHTANGEATLHVLVGRARLRWGSGSVELAAGDVVDIPDETHAVDALADAVLLLTVAVR